MELCTYLIQYQLRRTIPKSKGGIYEDMNRIYGSSIFDSAARRKNTLDVKPFDLKVPFHLIAFMNGSEGNTQICNVLCER